MKNFIMFCFAYDGMTRVSVAAEYGSRKYLIITVLLMKYSGRLSGGDLKK
jgi:hypothetical protein